LVGEQKQHTFLLIQDSKSVTGQLGNIDKGVLGLQEGAVETARVGSGPFPINDPKAEREDPRDHDVHGARCCQGLIYYLL
jgi:hypothetical protein